MIESISEGVKFPDVHFLSYMKYMFVRISDFLKNTALEMSHCVSTRIEMVARWLFQHFRPHILFVFSHAELERSGTKANIFTPRVVRAVVLVLNTSSTSLKLEDSVKKWAMHNPGLIR